MLFKSSRLSVFIVTEPFNGDLIHSKQLFLIKCIKFDCKVGGPGRCLVFSDIA